MEYKVIWHEKVLRDLGTIDKKEHTGLQRTGGYIGFLSHDSVVRFRNMRIKVW